MAGRFWHYLEQQVLPSIPSVVAFGDAHTRVDVPATGSAGPGDLGIHDVVVPDQPSRTAAGIRFQRKAVRQVGRRFNRLFLGQPVFDHEAGQVSGVDATGQVVSGWY